MVEAWEGETGKRMKLESVNSLDNVAKLVPGPLISQCII